jgi:hypothetical protein
MLAAIVLCVSGIGKLRAPDAAAQAAAVIGLPGRPVTVRMLALIELVVGGWSLIGPNRLLAVALACMYVAFAALSLTLARRRAACGCFGDSDAPSTVSQALISAALALIALADALAGPHALGWVLAQPVARSATLLLATAASAYGVVAAYTELPQAWTSWSRP